MTKLVFPYCSWFLSIRKQTQLPKAISALHREEFTSVFYRRLWKWCYRIVARENITVLSNRTTMAALILIPIAEYVHILLKEQFLHKLNLTYTANRDFFYDTLSHPVAQAETNYYMYLLIHFTSPFPYMRYKWLQKKAINICLVIIANRNEGDEHF